MKIEDEITEENRDLVGFMGIDDEYLVLSPTFIQGGKVCRVDTIGFILMLNLLKLFPVYQVKWNSPRTAPMQ